MHSLASYLVARVPEGISYSDAVQLCLRLYCTVDGVPDALLPLSKETLASAFSELASAGWVRGGGVQEATTPRHWAEAVGAVFKTGPDAIDMERGQALAHQVGFIVGRAVR
jgi:hypothetical protein